MEKEITQSGCDGSHERYEMRYCCYDNWDGCFNAVP